MVSFREMRRKRVAREKRKAAYAPGGKFGDNFINRLFPGINDRNIPLLKKYPEMRATGTMKESKPKVASGGIPAEFRSNAAYRMQTSNIVVPTKKSQTAMKPYVQGGAGGTRLLKSAKPTSKIDDTAMLNVDRLFLAGTRKSDERKQRASSPFYKYAAGSQKGSDGRVSTTKYLREFEQGKKDLDKKYRQTFGFLRRQLFPGLTLFEFQVDPKLRRKNLKGKRNDPRLFM